MGGNGEFRRNQVGELRRLRGGHGVSAADGDEKIIALNGYKAVVKVAVPDNAVAFFVCRYDIAYPVFFARVEGFVFVVRGESFHFDALDGKFHVGFYRRDFRRSDTCRHQSVDAVGSGDDCRFVVGNGKNVLYGQVVVVRMGDKHDFCVMSRIFYAIRIEIHVSDFYTTVAVNGNIQHNFASSPIILLSGRNAILLQWANVNFFVIF